MAQSRMTLIITTLNDTEHNFMFTSNVNNMLSIITPSVIQFSVVTASVMAPSLTSSLATLDNQLLVKKSSSWARTIKIYGKLVRLSQPASSTPV